MMTMSTEDEGEEKSLAKVDFELKRSSLFHHHAAR
jgi:hypothetical protein